LTQEQATRNKMCSRKCMAKDHSQKRLGVRKKPGAICCTCGKEFWTRNKALNKAKFCGMECYGVHKKNDPKVLEHLKKIASKGRAGWTKKSYLSYSQNMSGSKNPAWKGGVTYFKQKGNYKNIKYISDVRKTI